MIGLSGYRSNELRVTGMNHEEGNAYGLSHRHYNEVKLGGITYLQKMIIN